MTDTVYTAISFAPVQGFIEKSRKLRDLFGASLILSYLSQKLVEEFHHPPELEVISPALIHVQEGMPNRILIRGYVERSHVQNTLLKHWQHLLQVCREWVETNVPADYHWSQKPDQVGKEKGEWERWGSYAWEVFWGKGDSPIAAMEDLETRKLKRDWVAVNWVGESSSLSGTDAIAWHRLGDKDLIKRDLKGELTSADRQELKQELDDFYLRLSQALEDSSADSHQGKFLRPNERLSIPELAKRLVTRYEGIGEHLDESFKIESFSEMVRMPEPGQSGHWTGWFMGDGDKVGDHLKGLSAESELQKFSNAMRQWGKDFKNDFPKDLGRVVYAGGDDFMGIIYSDKPHNPILESKALDWLTELNSQWKNHGQPINLSVGFVWAGHSVPQRDVLQHCREAEKQAKNLGRDRVTIRLLFNSGQCVQWTCPWDYLDILTKYRDRDPDRINTQEEIDKGSPKRANWNHIYSDWAQLKARHAISLQGRSDQVDDHIALKIFELYFNDMERFERHSQDIFKQDDTPKAVIEWLDGLVNVGWQLCSNT
jgi:CRISPR-associated protein Cmr2